MFFSLHVSKISFDRLTSILSGNNDLARRFFQLVTLLAANSYLRKLARTENDDIDEQQIEQKMKLEKTVLTPVILFTSLGR